jgi:type I restriction enzyme S subunit
MKGNLPKGWALSPIGELYDFIGGGTPDKKNPIYWDGEIPWATVKDIKGKYLSDTIDHISEDGLKHSAATLASEGDLILVTRISPGSSIIAKNRIAINQDLKIVKHYAGMLSEFSFYYFTNIEKKILEISSGTTVSGIRLNILREVTAAVPPLPEQHRIVAKIEQFFSELDKGVAGLKKARETLALYRQSLLKAAFEGRLTEKWRREHADELESADQLLARIKSEREKHYRQQVEEWRKAVKDWEAQGSPGRKPAKPRKPKELKPLNKEDVADLSKLPEGWGWVTIEDLCPIDRMISYGVLQPGAHIDNGVRLIRVGDIDNGKIDSANLKRIGHDISKRYKKTI